VSGDYLETTHSVNCWRWHHQCGVRRIRDLAAALTGALGAFQRADDTAGGDVFTATVPASQLDEWHRLLELADMDVAGADVTPDPAAPATTTT
jgi:hypothetical protein